MVVLSVFFCDQEESMQHLFLDCPFAKIIWRIVDMTFNIRPPVNITNLFGNWLNGVANKDKGYIRVGVCALLWAIWNVRNDFVFNKKKLSIIPAGYPYGYALDPYMFYLQPPEERHDMDIWCKRLAMVA
jgi:hypothetical protein